MRKAGLLVARTLAAVEESSVQGTTTLELDRLAQAMIVRQGARPSFPDVPGYCHTLCVSVNDEVVHGIPSARRLATGDLVSVDCGASVDGWHGDAAVTFVVGGSEHAREADLALMEATRGALWAGIAAFHVGARLHDIGAAVEGHLIQASEGRPAGARSFGIVDGYEGHAIGREMHLPPGVPNFRTRTRGPRVPAGATVAIEPMVTLGTGHTRELADGWTVVTADGSRAAHIEHTVAATPHGPFVLTALDGGVAELSRLGMPCGAPTTARAPGQPAPAPSVVD